MYNTSFIKKILLVATVVLLYSCDKDFNAIGGDLIGDNHFGLVPENYDVLAYNQEITPIQSNSLAVNALGIYDNPVLGSTTANFNTQVSLATYAPTIGADPVIESVVLTVPYFSHVETANTDGTSIYVLDSIHGAVNGKLKLSVYESGVQMRSSYFDNGSQFAQLYYTDQNGDFDQYKKGDILNNDPKIAQNKEFFFDAKERTDTIVDATTQKKTVTRTAPQMRLDLDKAFFQTKILNAPAAKLSTADLFQEYFRGLYFKVERTENNDAVNMAMLDFASKGKITITYKAKTEITTDPAETTEEKTLEINLAGSNVSLSQDVKKAEYASAINSATINRTEGDERLYIKGGQGSLAVIELNGFGAKLDEIRTNKWLVNEANLVFHIDSDKMTGAEEPRRVYLYDLTNNLPVLDYADGTTGSLVVGDTKTTRYIFDGMINVGANKRGTTYKIRITNHIRDIIKNATVANVKLGLVVTEDISVIASNKLKNRALIDPSKPNEYFSEAPRASVMNPLGTILYGAKSTIPDDKRLKLEIYYTKPN